MKTLKVTDGDLFINRSTGQAKEITGVEYLSQAIPEALLTDFDGTWGSELNNFGGGNAARKKRAANANVSLIDTRITEAVVRIKAIQATDPVVTPEERFQNIRELLIFPFSQRGSFFFSLVISNASNKPIQIGFEEIVTLNHLIPIHFSDTEIKQSKATA